MSRDAADGEAEAFTPIKRTRFDFGSGADFADSFRKASKVTKLFMRGFKLLERNLEAGCREVGVEGELDMSVAGEFKDALANAARDGQRVLIDLRSCDFIDSTGIAVIVEMHNRVDRNGGRIVIHGASGQVRRVLSITGLTQNGLVFETAEEAIAAL